MTKYKFRGWDVIGNKWVYGDLVHNKKITDTGLEDRVMVGGYEVAPESVGLCTGEKDIDGKDVYESDVVSFECYGNTNHYQIKRFGRVFSFATKTGLNVNFWANEFKVIGTMFKDKELLEKE